MTEEDLRVCDFVDFVVNKIANYAADELMQIAYERDKTHVPKWTATYVAEHEMNDLLNRLNEDIDKAWEKILKRIEENMEKEGYGLEEE